MPEIGGLEATRSIRQKEWGTENHLPIVAVTAHASPRGSAAMPFEAGMDQYLSKPIDEDALFAVLENLLRTRTKSKLPNDLAETNGHVPSLFNAERLWAQVRGDREILMEVVSLFDEQSHELLRAMQEEAWESRDASSLARNAHRLAGSASNFHSAIIVEMARALEQSAQQADGSLPTLKSKTSHNLCVNSFRSSIALPGRNALFTPPQ